MHNARLYWGDIQLYVLTNLPPKRWFREDGMPTHSRESWDVSAVMLGIFRKLDPAFFAEKAFLFSVRSRFFPVKSAEFPNMPGSCGTDGKYFLVWIWRLWSGSPFVDWIVGIGYNRRSPAICQASWRESWIVENRNSADYMEFEETVKARRRQVSLPISFCDVKTRPYSLRAKYRSYLDFDLIKIFQSQAMTTKN